MLRHFVNEAGSHAKVGFTKKDLYNCVQKIRRDTIKDGDAETVMTYLFRRKAAFGNTVPFGCALVVNEKEDTFVWVLEQLIESGYGFRPRTMITNGDRAMANAIAKVFPRATHRLCLWHIMRNVKGNLKGSSRDGFMKCVKCRTPNDFENAWKEFVSVSNIEGKRWVIDLYQTKEKWAEAYLRGQFFAGMRSTQRCESMHRTLKKMLDQKVFLYDFVNRYHDELNKLRYEEGHQDYKTTHEQPVCDCIFSCLKSQISKIYTRNAYRLLCDEMRYEAYFLVKQTQSCGDPYRTYYWLEHVQHENLWYLVVNDIENDTMYCCCMKLESVGFPCRHMFAVLKYLNATQLPKGCIMTRWTMYAKESIDMLEEIEVEEHNSELVVQSRFSTLSSICMNICHQASRETFEVFKEIRDQFVKIGLNLHGRKETLKKRLDSIKQHVGINDPIVVENVKGGRKRKKVQASTSVPLYENDLKLNEEASK